MSLILFLKACIYDFLVVFVLLLSFNLAKNYLLSIGRITGGELNDLLSRGLGLDIVF